MLNCRKMGIEKCPENWGRMGYCCKSSPNILPVFPTMGNLTSHTPLSVSYRMRTLKAILRYFGRFFFAKKPQNAIFLVAAGNQTLYYFAAPVFYCACAKTGLKLRAPFAPRICRKLLQLRLACVCMLLNLLLDGSDNRSQRCVA